MDANGQDFTSMFVAVTVAMLVICALAVVILKWVFPRLIRAPLSRKGGPIRIVARYALEPHKAIYILKIGKRTMVVGSAERALTHLTDLNEEELASEWKI